MIVWNRENKHKFMSVKEREEFLQMHMDCRKEKILSIINIAINIAVPIAIFFLFGFNLIAFAISFILLDIVLNLFEQFTFVTFPYLRSKTLSTNSIKHRIEKIENKVKKIEERIRKLRKRYCNVCDYTYSYMREDYTSCKLMKALYQRKLIYMVAIEREKGFLDAQEEEQTKKEIISDERKSKDFDNKIEYLSATKKKIGYFIKNKELTCLSPINESLKKLIKILKTKPNGINFVPSSTYLYLDELQKILEKMTSMDKEKQDKYLSDIQKISDAMSNNLQLLIDKIDKVETEDIDVSITVLLQELTKGQEEKTDV